MACSVTRTAVSPATSLDIEPSAWSNGRPCRAIQAARQVSSRAASTAGLHVGEHERDGLVLPDRLAELDPLRGVVGGELQRRPATPDRHRGHRRPGRLEGLHRGLLAARLAALGQPGQPGVQLVLAADQAPAGHPHVIEDDLGGVRGADAVLAELLALGQALGARRDDEAGLAAAAQAGVDRGDDDVHVGDAAVGGPGLGAVQHPLVGGLLVDARWS